MQVDSELDWENNSDDTGDRRGPSPYQKRLKGFSKGTPRFEPQLGISLLPEHIKPSRIDMVDKRCDSQERSSNTLQATKLRYRHSRRCIRSRLGNQFSFSTNRRLLDKKEKEDSINGRELKAISFAIQLHMSRHKNSTTKIYSDNRTALKYLNKASGTSSMLPQNLATQIQDLYNKSNIQVICNHTPGIQNIKADCLGRQKLPLYEWSLPIR